MYVRIRNFGFFRNDYFAQNGGFSRLPLVDQCMAALKHTCFECPFKILVGYITFPQSSWNGKNSTTCSTCYSTARYSANSCTGYSDFKYF
jgi:hypothetical protein